MTAAVARLRICLVVPTLGAGGAERVAANLVNAWAVAGHVVAVITVGSSGDDFYALDPRVDRRGLSLAGESAGALGGLAANLRRVRCLRREIRSLRPDVVVAFIDSTNVLALIASAGLGIPVVVSERIDPRALPIGRAWDALRRLTYPFASRLVVQTESVAQWAHQVVAPGRTVVMPNPIDDRWIEAGRRAAGPRLRRVAAMGRLVPQKGFETLVDAFARAAAGRPDWSLVIAGQGPLEEALRRQAAATPCADRIVFAGLVASPEPLLAGSEMFVLSSRFEGFPNALVEAMASGCAVIATDCPSGPREIVTDGEDGLLVEVDDADGLAAALDRLMSNPDERRRLGAAAARSAQRFRLDQVADRWIGLLASLAGGPAPRSVVAADEPHCVPER